MILEISGKSVIQIFKKRAFGMLQSLRTSGCVQTVLTLDVDKN